MQSNPEITKKVPVCHSNQKIDDVKEYLFEKMSNFDTIDYIYVLTKSQVIKGVISIHELFKSPPDSLIRDHFITKIVKAHPDTDPEKIVHLALNNNIKSVPIVNEQNKFIGVIASDTILDILNKEGQEDFMHIEGIIPENIYNQQDVSIFKNFILRTPWIIVGLLGGLIAARIIANFESVLEKELILAAFIPLVAYVANAVGSQTQTLYIRALAMGQKISMWRYSIKQIFISFFIGVACWAVIGLTSLIVWNSSLLGVIVGFAVFCSILVATTFALLIPFLLTKFNKDPAIGSGPFTTIIQDMLSVLIYFLIATIFIL
ncbi:MAG: magnesium transporter [Candidatus Moranbacteria bacterium]|nr:magnesium transporter [Candidatus Moranbacteria bacterium]